MKYMCDMLKMQNVETASQTSKLSICLFNRDFRPNRISRPTFILCDLFCTCSCAFVMRVEAFIEGVTFKDKNVTWKKNVFVVKREVGALGAHGTTTAEQFCATTPNITHQARSRRKKLPDIQGIAPLQRCFVAGNCRLLAQPYLLL